MNIDESTILHPRRVLAGQRTGAWSRIGALLARMGDPEKQMRFIHVTGTNGKGSTCAMTGQRPSGSRLSHGAVHLALHLIRFNERMQVDGAPDLRRRSCAQITD